MLDQFVAPFFAFASILRKNRPDDSQTSAALASKHQPLIDALRDGKPDVIREGVSHGARRILRSVFRFQ
jgi:hypothetical protein